MGQGDVGMSYCGPPAKGLFPARKADLVLNGYLLTMNANYCMLVNEWVSLVLLWLKVHLGSVLVTEAPDGRKIRCVKDMYMLKVISSEKGLG